MQEKRPSTQATDAEVRKVLRASGAESLDEIPEGASVSDGLGSLLEELERERALRSPAARRR